MLDQKLEAYAKSDIYPFHMPGHKRMEIDFPNPYSIDITEIDGFDNLHHAKDILKESQERAAKLYGAKDSFYLVNGSTCGILAAICGATKKGDKILVARNCHKAVYHAIFLQELCPEYMYPQITDLGIQGQMSPKMVEQKLALHPDIKAVVITSPTYDGVVSDIKAIAEIVHRYEIPLIVDEAHGAHFGFSEKFPQNAVKLGADAVIVSLHKTLPSFTQTALLHLCSNRISKERVAKYLGIFETSSPSYLFMAGMEKCIRLIREDGAQLFAAYEEKLEAFYHQISDLEHITILTRNQLKKEDAYDFDFGKIVMFPDDCWMNGNELQEILLKEYHLQMEMAADSYVVAITSIMDTKEGFDRLADALHEIDKRYKNQSQKQKKNRKSSEIYTENEKVLEIAKADDCEKKVIPLEQAAGQISGEFVFLYPPGIPIIVPGERITEKFISDILKCLEDGLDVEGLAEINPDFLKSGISIVNFS